jgi:hypothetical protein
MNAQSSIFPAFIRAEYDSSGSGFPAFQRAAESAAAGAKRTFEGAFADIQRTVNQALSMPRVNGQLDLGVPQMRQAVQAAEAQASAYRQVAQAAELAQRETRDTSEATRLYVQAARAAAIEAEQNAQSMRVQANAADALQQQLGRLGPATTSIVNGFDRFGRALDQTGNGARNTRFAYVQLGQQLQDAVIQAQLGTNALVILTQQGSQAAFAFADMGGKVGAFARFLSGPFGAAVLAAITVVGLLTTKLLENGDAAKLAETGSSGLAVAQSVLGEMFDLTSGKLERQNELLILNARLTALNLRAEAMRQKASSSAAFEDATKPGLIGRLRGFAESGPSGRGLGLITGSSAAVRNTDRLRTVLSNVQSGNLSREDALRFSVGFDFKDTGVTREEFQKAIIDAVSADLKNKTADLIDQSLASGELAEGLRREGRKKKPRAGRAAAERLEEFGEDAEKRIANIAGRFSETPRLIESGNRALRELDDIIDDLNRKKPKGFQDIVAEAEKAKKTVLDGMVKPFNDFLEQSREQAEITSLLVDGREDEANALSRAFEIQRRQGALTREQLETVLETVQAERERNQLMRDRDRLVGGYVGAVQNIRASLERTVSDAFMGKSSAGAFGKSLIQGYADLQGQFQTEKLFGPLLRQLEDEATGRGTLRRSSEDMVSSLDLVSQRLRQFADTVIQTGRAVTEAVPANDNPFAPTGSEIAFMPSLGRDLDRIAKETAESNETINVMASRLRRDVTQGLPGPGEFYTKGILLGLDRVGLKFKDGQIDDLSKKIGGTLDKVMSGFATGSFIGGAIGGRTGARIGGSLLGGLGAIEKLAGPNSPLGKLAGRFGAIGELVSSVVGIFSAVGALFKGAPRASATIGAGGGKVAVSSVTGNSAKFQKASSSGADSAISTLQSVAEQLGGSLNGDGTVSIGIRNGSYRVDPTGRGITKTKKGAIDFGEDATAAVKAATLDLIRDGVIEGIRASTQRLLQNAKDFDSAVDKALRFEGVFTRLKQIEDPVGAAIDAVDKEFKGLRKIFDEAGASAEELAQLEKLYGLERAKAIKVASEEMTQTLKDLLSELKTGDNGRSLRDRMSAALAEYNPLASDLAAGKTVDYDAYAAAARTVLDLERQLSGSQDAYFARLDEITNLTAKALKDQENVIALATAKAPAITPAGATPANDNVVGAIGTLSSDLLGGLGPKLDAVNANLGNVARMIQGLYGSAAANRFLDGARRNF